MRIVLKNAVVAVAFPFRSLTDLIVDFGTEWFIANTRGDS